jgi:hypothetical protein
LLIADAILPLFGQLGQPNRAFANAVVLVAAVKEGGVEAGAEL